MLLHTALHRRLPLAIAIGTALALGACSSNDDAPAAPDQSPLSIPAPPADQGAPDGVPVPAAVAFVDTAASNQRGDARYATSATNAGVRVLAGFRDIWQPLSEMVDAGASAPAVDGFPAVAASSWSGVPNDGTPDGTVRNAAIHNANIEYVVQATLKRTPAQALAAYMDDRRGKGYSMTEGLGPLTAAWREAARQTTSITGIAADATTVAYNDSGNNRGVGGSANPAFGSVVDLISAMGNNGSTEPAKRFYKYARPYRWSSRVVVVPALEPAKSKTPTTDGGFTSGHSAEAVRDAIGMAYVLPERYQELLSRALEMGESRIWAGMHSPLDVLSGRIQAQAVAASNLLDPANATAKVAAHAQAHATLMTLTGSTPETFRALAQSGTPASDRFADHAVNKANYLRRLTYGFPQIGATNAPAMVPKGAEVLLETRLPYLSAAQRRAVLKTTAVPSGYPVMDDPEGWGRLNLFDAADGYGALSGSVVLVMDAAKGGFHASDRWRNDIGGSGKLVKQGSGALALTGNNSWSGGTQLDAGTLEARSAKAFGAGDVYVGGGTLVANAAAPVAVTVRGQYTQLTGSTLQVALGSATHTPLTVGGNATIGGGTLRVTFQNGYKPAAGTMLTVVSAASLKGKFSTITVDGATVTPTYSGSALTLRIGG